MGFHSFEGRKFRILKEKETNGVKMGNYFSKEEVTIYCKIEIRHIRKTKGTQIIKGSI